MKCACAILSSVACPVYNIFPHYCINCTIFEKKIEQKCVVSFPIQILSEIFLIIRSIRRDIVINLHKSSCTVPIFLVRI